MNPKKATRIFFYALLVGLFAFLLTEVLAMLIRHGALLPVVLTIAGGVSIYGLFKLADWAFTPDRTQEPSDFPVPTSKKGKTND